MDACKIRFRQTGNRPDQAVLAVAVKLFGDGISVLGRLACPRGLGPRRQEDGDDG